MKKAKVITTGIKLFLKVALKKNSIKYSNEKDYFYKITYCIKKNPKSKLDGEFRLGDKCQCCNKII